VTATSCNSANDGMATPTCNQSNGAIEIQVTGGSGNYSYSTGQVIRTDLPRGVYTPIVTDFTIIEEAGFVTPQRVEILRTDDQTIYQNGQLTPGDYCINVYDGNDCLAGNGCFAIISPTPLNVSSLTTNADCNQQGNINLTVNGGTPPYSYNWSNTNATTNAINVDAGTYAVTISDANNCTLILTDFSIVNDCITCEEPQIISTVITDANCNENNGSILINMSGDATDYTFAWTPSNLGNTSNPTELLSRDYTVTNGTPLLEMELIKIILRQELIPSPLPNQAILVQT